MDQQRWEMIREVFDAALELPSSERETFIRGASQEDAEAYSELKSLLHADEEAGDFLESPLLAGSAFQQLPAPEQPFQPGEVLCQRFRILRAVGEGGMGYVFEAWDTELRRSVALKAIRPEIAGNLESLKRFRMEVSLALRITHPNVCRTFDIERETRAVDTTTGRTQEVVFLTMEFLQGETLAARLSRTGALPLDEALRIARQIADALTCAHELGIYHRDIKPANVMLVPAAASQSSASPFSSESPRAVITDFGLARQETLLRSDGLSGVSSSGIPLGTFAYMAPEQLECAETSAATDIYAFGLVLFEMVTGKRAFASSNPLSGIKRRLTGPAPSPQSLAPNLPEPWRRAIEGSLRLDPAERLQCAADVVAILEGGTISLPPVRMGNFISHGPSTSQLPRAPWSIRRRFFALATILVVAVSLSIGGLRLYQSKADSKVAPGALVYLTQVKNQTGEKAFDNLTELIQAGLTQSAQINLLDQGRVGDILQQMTKSPDTVITEPIAREIAMRAGAVRVVFATVTGTNGNYKLNINIQQPDASSPNRYRDHWPKSFEWQSSGDTNNQGSIPQELLSAVRKTSDWIRREAGESQNDIARLDTPPEDVTTSSWAALADYSQAEVLGRDDQPGSAVVALQSAIGKDPHFSLAYARLGDILLSLHRDIEGYHAYETSLDLSQQGRLTRKEEDRIRGMRAVDTRDYQLAVDAFHDYSVNYKNDYLGWVYPTVPLRMLGRNEEAIANLRKAIALDPARSFAPYSLAEELMIVGRLDEVPQWIDHLNRYKHFDVAEEVTVAFLCLNGRYDEAAKILESFSASTSPLKRMYSYRQQASLAAERGRFREALSLLDRGLVEINSQNNTEQRAATLLDRAYLELKLDQFEQAILDVRTGFSLSKTPEGALVADTVLGNAFAIAPVSFVPAIRQELEEIEKAFPAEEYGTISVLVKLRTHGELLLANGDAKTAVEVFYKAEVEDAPASSREYLGRALVALAEHRQKSAPDSRLLTGALNAYSTLSQRPAIVWSNLIGHPPGSLADELRSYLRVSEMRGTTDSTTGQRREMLTSIRGGHSGRH